MPPPLPVVAVLPDSVDSSTCNSVREPIETAPPSTALLPDRVEPEIVRSDVPTPPPLFKPPCTAPPLATAVLFDRVDVVIVTLVRELPNMAPPDPPALLAE